MGPYQVPRSPEKLEIPLEHGQADHPFDDSADDSESSDPEINDDVGLPDVDHPENETFTSEIGSMIVQQGSCDDLDTSSTDPTLAVLLETSDEDSADDILARWSPILFRISPMSESDDAEMPAEMGDTNRSNSQESDGYMGDQEQGSSDDAEMPAEMGDTNSMRHLTDTSNSQESWPESDTDDSIITDGGYMGDIESGPEIDYTVYTTEELGQREMMFICAEQLLANGLARLTQFRIPPPKSAICPICQINNK